jgi:hypothetical protein
MPTDPPVTRVTPDAASENGLREILAVREEARDALGSYAEALRFWNAPDDEHTRHQLRAVLDEAMDEAGL